MLAGGAKDTRKLARHIEKFCLRCGGGKNSIIERGALDKRLEPMNEFSAHLKDQAGTLASRKEVNRRIVTTVAGIRRLELPATQAAKQVDMTATPDQEGKTIKLIAPKINN
jgi:hypothetical protein